MRRAAILEKCETCLLSVAIALLAAAFLLGGCASPSTESGSGSAAISASEKQDVESDSVEDAVGPGDHTAKVVTGAKGQAETGAASTLQGKLAAVAEQDPKAIKNCLSLIGFDPQDYGISWEVLAKTCYSDFGFAVDEVEAGKDSEGGIGVAFRVRAPRMGDAVGLMYKTSKKCLEDGANARKSGYADKAWKKAWKQAGLESVQLSAVLYLREDGKGSWKIEDEGTFAALLMGGYDPRQA